MAQVLSTDPNWGATASAAPRPSSGAVLSTDPNWGSDAEDLTYSPKPRHPHQQMTEVLKGVAKGAGGIAFGVGKALRDYTPIGRLTDAVAPGVFDERPEILEPTNTPQTIGRMAAEVGSFFVPVGGATRVARAVGEVAKAGGLTLAQTDSPAMAGASMGITAAFPGGAALVKAGDKLRKGAEKTVVQALGPTKEKWKDVAAKIAPEMLDRGVKGSRAGMLERATEQVKSIGPQIGHAVETAAAEGKTVSGDAVRGALEIAKRGLVVGTEAGPAIPIEGAQAAVKQLDRLSTFVQQLGADIPIDKAHAVKQAWQRIVDKAGFYGPKATSSATDNAKAWATREAERSMRRLIADQSDDLAALNREFSFWKGLQDVLTATEKRTQAQGAGLVAAIGGAAGAASGMASGDSAMGTVGQALLGGVAGRQVIKLMQSPQWRTMVSAPLKNKLADALMSGRTDRVQQASRIVVTSLPARFRPSPVAEMMPAVGQEPSEEGRPPAGRPQ